MYELRDSFLSDRYYFIEVFYLWLFFIFFVYIVIGKLMVWGY